MKKKLLMSLLVSGLIVGLATPSIIRASALEEVKTEEVEEIIEPGEPNTDLAKAKEIIQMDEDIKVTPLTLAEPAFPASSQPLHDAILNAYPEINTDIDGSIGYISKGEASIWAGTEIDLSNQGLTGTIDGVEYFTNIKVLDLSTNELVGIIPENIGNMNSLEKLRLSVNLIEGTIPESIGKLENLIDFRGAKTLITGEVPLTLSNLNLTWFTFSETTISGDIGILFSSMENLKYFYIQNTNFTGNIESMNTSNMVRFSITGTKLVGDPTIAFSDNTTLDYYDVTNSSVLQVVPEIPTLSLNERSLYDDLASALLNSNEDNLAKGITQKDIDFARDSANSWREPIKSEWLNKVEKAQVLYDEKEAQNAVEDLFDKDGNIKDIVTQEDINNAQNLVDKVADEEKKQELQDKLDEAQKQLDERNFVVLEAFKTFTGTGTVSTTIDAPVEKFSKVYVDGKLLPSSNYVVTSGSTVITLNENYLKTLSNGTYNVEVEFVSGAKVSVPLTVDVKTITDPTNPVDPVDPTNPVKPTDPTTPTKPSVDGKPSVAGGTTVSGNNSVNTGDETNTMMLYTMLATSLLGLIVVIKRKKETE